MRPKRRSAARERRFRFEAVRLQLGQIQTVLAGEIFDGHAPQCAECTGGHPKFDEASLRFTPNALCLQVWKLALFGLDVRMRNLVGHIRALSGQWAYASHVGLRSVTV